jgi:hypothetical protein
MQNKLVRYFILLISFCTFYSKITFSSKTIVLNKNLNGTELNQILILKGWGIFWTKIYQFAFVSLFVKTSSFDYLNWPNLKCLSLVISSLNNLFLFFHLLNYLALFFKHTFPQSRKSLPWLIHLRKHKKLLIRIRTREFDNCQTLLNLLRFFENGSLEVVEQSVRRARISMGRRRERSVQLYYQFRTCWLPQRVFD